MKGYGLVTELMHVAAVATLYLMWLGLLMFFPHKFSLLVGTAESESGIKALPNKAIFTANRLTVRHK